MWAFVMTLAGQTVPGWASTVVPIYVVCGVQLFSLGVIGEYVGLIFDEVKGRPRYLVKGEFGETARSAMHRNSGRSEVDGDASQGSLGRAPQGVHD
jgi:hypothetical protein